jgi:urea transport system permease protein
VTRALHSLLAALALSWSCAGHALADGNTDLPALTAQLGSGDEQQVEAAILKLGEQSDPRALELLTQLRDGKLTVAGKDVPVNNTLRRALTPAIAQLQLRSGDVQVRRDAAEALSKSVDARLEKPMRAALAAESDARVRKLLALTLAQIDFDSVDVKRRIAAIAVMGDSGEIGFKAQLAALLEKDAGHWKEPNAELRGAAQTAVDAIERKEVFTRVVRDLFYGLSLGSVLLLAALGLAITFGVMRVINMAHGEMLMFGSYSTYVAQLIFQKYAPGAIEYYLVLAVPLAFVVCMLAGIVLERSVIRFLYGRPLETLLATWGISLMLIQTVRLLFGAQNVTVANPQWLSGGWEVLPGVVLPYNRLATIAFASAIVLFVAWVLNRTRLGLQVRAITQNRAMAGCMGVKTARIDMLTFGLGSAIAGLGGVALSQIGNVGPELGQLYIVDSFMVVVVGGVGKIIGSVVAAIGLGAVNKLLEPVAGAVLGKIFVLAFVVLFIQRRPQGLFAQKGRAAET